jgi:hypothetical protein
VLLIFSSVLFETEKFEIICIFFRNLELVIIVKNIPTKPPIIKLGNEWQEQISAIPFHKSSKMWKAHSKSF